MPTYVYRFTDTGETIEVQQAFSDPTLSEFAHPGTGEVLPVKKVFQPVGVTFKGSGFFKTDNRNGKKSSNSSGSSDSSSPSTSDASSSSASSSGASSGSSSGSDSSGSSTKSAANSAAASTASSAS